MQIPADLPPRWFLGVIRELSIDTVTGMVKVEAENGQITYIQPAQAQSRLDAEVQEARRRLGHQG